MPVLRIWDAYDGIILKRSMASGLRRRRQPTFNRDNSAMRFGDTKDRVAVTVEMVTGVAGMKSWTIANGPTRR